MFKSYLSVVSYDLEWHSLKNTIQIHGTVTKYRCRKVLLLRTLGDQIISQLYFSNIATLHVH